MQQHAQFSSFLALRCRRDGPNTGPAVRHAATAAMSAASTVQPAATVARSSARPGAGLPALTRSVHRAGAAAVAAGLVDDLVAGAPRPVRGLHRGGLPGRRQRDAGHAVAPGGLLRLGLRRTDVTRRWRVPARGRVVRAGQRVGGALVVGGAAGLVVVGAGVRRGGVEVSHGLDDGARLRDARWEREGRRRGGGGLMLLVVVLDVLEDLAGVRVGALVEVARRPPRTAGGGRLAEALCSNTHAARNVRLCRVRSRV
jgi:hypothetical protein